MATASKTTIVEVEELVEKGQLNPDEIHLPGIYVKRIIVQGEKYERKLKELEAPNKKKEYTLKIKIAKRAAEELKKMECMLILELEYQILLLIIFLMINILSFTLKMECLV